MANLYYFLDMRRPHNDGRGTLTIALQHNRKVVYKSLGIYLLPTEWEGSRNQVTERADKKFLNIEHRNTFMKMSAALERVMQRKDYNLLSAKDIIEMISRTDRTVDEPGDLDYVVPVYNEYIALCKKTGTAQLYKASLKNLIEYCAGEIDTLQFRHMNVAWLTKYQNWLLVDRGMTINGANVYLRNLRRIFNWALKNEYTRARYPFKDIDMSTTEPDKDEIPYEKFLEWAAIPIPDGREFYRDLFMLSFYLCGIRPVDLLNVKKEQVKNGRLVYYPEKLGGKTKLSIFIEPEAWEIIHRYEGKEHLINIMDTRSDYKAFMAHWIAALRAIGKDVITQKVGRNGKKYSIVKHIGIIPHIKIYDARTCWGTYAYNLLEAPMDIISQGYGHKSGLKVTNFYVKRDTKKVDAVNRELITRVREDIEQYRRKKFPSGDSGSDPAPVS